MKLSKHAGLLVFLAAAAIAVAFQGSRGLYETTEGRYAEAAREMLETGDWLVPRLDYHPHWTKPPLFYWTMMLGMKAFGVNEWGVRLPNALALCLLTLTVISLGTAMWDRNTGLLAGLIVPTTFFSLMASHIISTDLILALWQLLIVLAYWKALRAPGDGRERAWWIRGLWLFAGLAFLTKGPPGLFSLVAILIAHPILRRKGEPVPRLADPLGLITFAVVGFSWYVVVIVKTPGLLSYLVGDEIVNRVVTDKFVRNSEWYRPFTIYIPPLTLGLGPWFFFWPSIVRKHRSAFRLAGMREALERDSALMLLAIWLGFCLVFFALCQSRLPLYVLPCFFAVVLITARGIVKSTDPGRMWRTVIIVAAITGVALIVLKGIAAHRPSDKDMRAVYQVCMDATRGDTAYLVVDDQKTYGLQFYLQGKMKRVSSGKREEWAQYSWDELVDEITHHRKHDRYILMVNESDTAEFRDTVASTRLTPQSLVKAKRYHIYAVDPPVASPGPSD